MLLSIFALLFFSRSSSRNSQRAMMMLHSGWLPTPSCTSYFPMQKFLKIFPSTSSVEISPMMEPRW